MKRQPEYLICDSDSSLSPNMTHSSSLRESLHLQSELRTNHALAKHSVFWVYSFCEGQNVSHSSRHSDQILHSGLPETSVGAHRISNLTSYLHVLAGWMFFSRAVGQRLMFWNGLYFFFSQVSPYQQDRFQPNFHKTPETVNIRILWRQNLEFLSVGDRRVEKKPKTRKIPS